MLSQNTLNKRGHVHVHVHHTHRDNVHNPALVGSTTLQCSVDGLELFSCVVSNEDDTALSILDPVSVGVELKPIEDGHGQKKGGTHLLEVRVTD